MSLLKFLGFESTDDSSSTDETASIRKISRELQQLDPSRARFLAAFAYLLGRVAHADLEISDDETAEMERIVMDKGHLEEQHAVMVVEIAKHQNRLLGHVDNFLVTREFNNLADQTQKLELLDCLFAVCAADGSVSSVEDREIRQIASELLLEHRQFIKIRSRYREALALFQDGVPGD